MPNQILSGNPKSNASIAAAYFFLFSVLEGLQRLSGIFYLENIQTLGLNRQSAAIPFTLSRAVANVIGPLFKQVIQSENSGKFNLGGVLLSATGTALCIFAGNLTHLIIFWGLIFGIGYAIVSHNQPAASEIANNWEMVSSSSTGYGFMSIILALMLDTLISNYGIQGSYIVLSGIILHYLPLALAANYNIRISLPIMKWRVRKRNSKYSISEEKVDDSTSYNVTPRIVNISMESFVHSLEPDVLRKVTMSEDDGFRKERLSSFVNEMSKGSWVSSNIKQGDDNEITNNEVDLKNIIDKVIPSSRTLSEVILDVQNYEKRRNPFEDSFSYPKISEDTGPIVTVFETNASQNNKLGRKVNKDDINKVHITSASQTEEPLKQAELHSSSAKQNLITNPIASVTCINKANFTSPPQLFQSNSKTLIPLDIKVRVVECTFTSNTDYWDESQTQYPRKGYRRHSNSIPLGCYDNIDFTNPAFLKKCSNYSELNKLHLNLTPNIFSISEEVELSSERELCSYGNDEDSQNSKVKNCSFIKMSKEILKNVNKVALPVWICVLLTSAIYEFSLTSLILIFADFSRDIGNNCSDFKWILIAFGVGGIVGRLFFNKVGKQVSDKPYATDIVLFMLNGLVTAGILWSPDLNWLAGFYCFLGALEVGTSGTIARLVRDYIDKDSQSTLYSASKIWSGAAVLTIPYAIGASRDYYGDYELLLQGISCTLVLCSILCYFLPKMTKASKHRGSPEV